MAVPSGRRTFARRLSLTSNQIFLQYYKEHDVFFAPEGILKMISLVCCVALSLAGGAAACARAPRLAPGAAGVALAVAAALALLVGARALQLPLRAPHAFLLTDIIACSVSGVAAALLAALHVALCRAGADTAPAHYLPAPLALVTAALLIASASLTFFTAMRLWDAAAGPAREPHAQPAPDHDV